jgi:Tol biopolymer transport system component
MKAKQYLLPLALVFTFAFSSCQVIVDEDWQGRFASWGDSLNKEAWQLGIMFGLEMPSSIPINSIDEGMIAFVATSKIDEGSDAIFLISQNRQVSKIVDAEDLPEEMEFSGKVFWSPKGDLLAFPVHKLCPLDDGSAYQCEAAVFLVDIDTKSLRQISAVSEFAENPVWSPDGTSLVYRITDLNDPIGDDYFAVRLDGGGRVRLSDTPDRNVSWGQWSPDQQKFSYLSDNEKGMYLNIVSIGADPDTTLNVDISYFGSDGESQAASASTSGFYWSPDGRNIAFSNGPASVSQRQNFIMDVNSGEIVPLSERIGLLIYGWLDAKSILAEDHLQGIVGVALDGELISIVDGVLYPASGCSISPNAEAIILSHYDSNLTIPQEDIYKNFVWSITEEEVITRIDLVDYSAGEPCWIR